ncbi:tyrosine-type recombinase/integrase [Sporosarcina sp. FSL K6-5500]|uniref:tyrosine-type recombinase/integrase n=1 Tax=Sporosarcina sp. FSL K6-5500 TaxID=2921558 RepID=UPI0030F8E02B
MVVTKLLTTCNEELEQHLIQKEMSPETIRSYKGHNDMVIYYFNTKNNCPTFVDDLSTEDLEGYLHHLKHEKGYKPASLNVVLNAVRRLYQYAIRKKYVLANPTADIAQAKVQREERPFLNAAEINELLKAIDHKLIRLLVRTLAYTGLRISECIDLTLKDVDFEQKVIRVINGKGGKNRSIPLSEELAVDLKAYVDNQRPKVASENFFALKKTGTISDQYVNRELKVAVKKLGWTKHVTCHTLRHSFASILVKNNANIPTVAKLLGHADYRTVTSIYIHVETDDLADAVNQITLV